MYSLYYMKYIIEMHSSEVGKYNQTGEFRAGHIWKLGMAANKEDLETWCNPITERKK